MLKLELFLTLFGFQAAHFTYEFHHILPPHVTLAAKLQVAYPPLTAGAIDVRFIVQDLGGVDGDFHDGLEGGVEGGRDGGLQK